MGKKTNWTVTEDQTLCHAWLDASDLQLQTGDHKATNFWTSVHDLFQQKVESAAERPLNGLKIRWTRINRDSQKFALIFHEVQSHGMKIAQENSGQPGDAAAVALLTEQQWVEEAKDQFLKVHNSKFSFETCWKMLRYAPKWQQLVDNSSSRAPALTAPTFLTEETKNATEVLTTSVPHERAEQTQSSVDVAVSSPASQTTVSEHSSPTSETTSTPASTSTVSAAITAAASMAVAAAAAFAPSVTVTAPAASATTPTVPDVASPAADANAFAVSSGRHKRRVTQEPMDSGSYAPIHQFYGLANALVDEIKRHNDLLEDQNAIALLRVDPDMIADSDGRNSFHVLRNRYLKRARTTSNDHSNTHHQEMTNSVV
ncbi:hypothetical protein PHYBOEH_000024 [Phytophthora boehmeriae]|uniref:No apical meristem-associated C-terminal domain-containing protein n=1 Tax=Phytophthora boehmeriae TaxID=109152 RepID=A0A8T1X8V6_9STRA|nr:hypothetical protein PHYBOEH_000024 [Phytophthora boehmeriae]